MSTVVIAWCWPLVMAPAPKAVLISLADQANDDGVCWPAVGTIATRTCLSERTIQRALLDLEHAGILEKRERPGRSTVYTLRRPAAADPRQGVTPTPVTVSPHPRHRVTPGGDTVTPESSVEPSKEPTPLPPKGGVMPTGRSRKSKPPATLAEVREATEVIEFLNRASSSRFLATPVNLGFIVDRMREGYSAHVLKLVVHDRVQRWRNDPRMRDYLRPATLFNAEKCNSYAGQIPTVAVRFCERCERGLLPGERVCPVCPAPAKLPAPEAIYKPRPKELDRREGEPIMAWVRRQADFYRSQQQQGGEHGSGAGGDAHEPGAVCEAGGR